MRLVGHLDVPGARVGLGVDGDGGDAEPLGRAHDAAGDLAAVGDQQLSKCMGISGDMTKTEYILNRNGTEHFASKLTLLIRDIFHRGYDL